MPNRLKQVVAGLVMGLCAILPAAASAQTVDEIISRGKLIIAVDTTTPPYGFLDAELKPTGFDIEVANRMGEALGVPVEFVTVTSPGRIPALLTKQVDAVVSIFSITPARAIQIDYSIPYAGQSAVVIAPKGTAIKSHADLVGKKVGLTRGTGEDGLLTAAAEDRQHGELDGLPDAGEQPVEMDEDRSELQGRLHARPVENGGGGGACSFRTPPPDKSSGAIRRPADRAAVGCGTSSTGQRARHRI